MDTFFTTFLLSPSPGMAPPWPLPPQCTTVIENCFAELDFMSPSSNKGQFNTAGLRGYFAMDLSSISKKAQDPGRRVVEGWGDFGDQQTNMCISPVTDLPTPSDRYHSSVNNNTSTSLFNYYFLHQLQHMAFDRRMQSSLQTSKCCLRFGMSNCGQAKEYCCCCCSMEYCQTKLQNVNNNQDEEEPPPCPCAKQEEGDRYCDVHNLVIRNMEVGKRSCMWTIYFSIPDEKDGWDDDEDEEQCFLNPCYEDDCENVSDDTFEIEFTNDIQSFTAHIACNNDEFFDIYEFGQEHYPNLIYESSDDEGDCHEIINSGLIISSTWSSDFVFSNTNEVRKADKKSFPLESKLSKYHKKCIHSSSVIDDDDNNNKTDGAPSTVYQKLKKKVHFPEPEKLVTVHRLVAWAHAYRQSRKSIWFKAAQDRTHFRRRIMNITEILDPVLKQKYSTFLLTN